MTSFLAQLYQMLSDAFSDLFEEPFPYTIEKLTEESDQIMLNYPNRGGEMFRWRHSLRPRLPYAKPRDTATAAFYRLYQFFIVDDIISYRNELEYFCSDHPEWAVDKLPDPKDTAHPSRYAALAAITYLMVGAFNRRIELGLPRDAPAIVEDFDELARRPRVLERVPAWAEAVQPLSNTLYIADRDGCITQDNSSEISPDFKKYNIIMAEPHIHFI
jgi:hypothetical protein